MKVTSHMVFKLSCKQLRKKNKSRFVTGGWRCLLVLFRLIKLNKVSLLKSTWNLAGFSAPVICYIIWLQIRWLTGCETKTKFILLRRSPVKETNVYFNGLRNLKTMMYKLPADLKNNNNNEENLFLFPVILVFYYFFSVAYQ